MAGHFHAGWNMPGYLPETEPEAFQTLDSAYEYLYETLEQWIESDAMADFDNADDLAEASTIAAEEILNRGDDYIDGWYQLPTGTEMHLWAQPAEDDDGCEDLI